MKISQVHGKVLGILATDMQKKLTKVCAKSILQNSSPESLKSFSWDGLIAELDSHAPTLTTILRGAVQVKRRVSVGQKKNRSDDDVVLCVCSAILLKHRNIHMNKLQRIVSLILYNGHASKQVTMHYRYVSTLNYDIYSATKAIALSFSQANSSFI